MSSPLINKNKETIPSDSKTLVEEILCPNCGGNGYTKSTPDCYHTCRDCFGKGVRKQVSYKPIKYILILFL